MSHSRSRKTLELALVLLVFLATNIASQIFQPHITLNSGQSFDGLYYYRVALQFAHGKAISTEAPFVYRIGTPFLVALTFPQDLLVGFKVVNIVANLLAVLLFTLWLRLYLGDWRLRVLLATLFITQWHGPVRFTYYDPTYTDPWMFVFLLAGLIAIQRLKSKPGILTLLALSLITFVGVLFREIVVILPLTLAFVTNPMPGWDELFCPFTWQKLVKLLRKPYYPFILPLLLGIAGFLVVRNTASQNNDYSFTQTALDWVYNKPVLTYLHAFFITYGPLIVLPVFSWRRSFRYLWEHQDLLVLLLGMMLIGWIGGSDTERFLYWAMPVVYLLLGLFIQENWPRLNSPWLILLLVVSTVCSQRRLWTVADYPNHFDTPIPILSILSNRFQYLDLWSFFAARPVQVISFLEYLVLSGVLIVWLKLRSTAAQPDLRLELSAANEH
jgi:hypothetical protein